MFSKKLDQKDKKVKNNDLSFLFFFLSSFVGFLHSFFFLLACSDIGNNQIILIKNFGFINIFCSVFTLLLLLVSCLFDYHKFIKKFSFFKKIGLSAYIFSITFCLIIFLFNTFFIKILFQIKNKDDFLTSPKDEYKNFFNFAITNFICVFFLCCITNILQLKARKSFFCFDEGQDKKTFTKKNDNQNLPSN